MSADAPAAADRRIEVCDETLRDGTQAEGIAFSVESKLRLLQEFDGLGIDFVVGGWPFSNPRDIEFFRRAKEVSLRHTQLMPFGSTRRKDNAPEDDPNLLALVETGCRHATIFGKSWELHATEILRVTLEENVEMIRSSVRFLTDAGMSVLYDAEHFFDGYTRNRPYALETLRAAVDGGAVRLVLCDTNGGTLPLELGDIVADVVTEFPGTPVGIHAHNDSGVGDANTLMGVERGASQVQGTFNGYGERCGNANLCAVVPNLALKMDRDCLVPGALAELTHVSRLVSELANHAHNERQAYVGRSAFAHKGGVHIDAARKNPLSYEHVEPELVGNKQRILISDQAGRSAIIEKLESEYPDLDKRSPEVQRVYDSMKEAEQLGYAFEGAEASWNLLARKAMGEHTPGFE
ncbi:citramalate synthase, partial [Candidatus Poribacteria bacterium]|nr:citramalate synthase [Candidatus Poribacteria bacterium]